MNPELAALQALQHGPPNRNPNAIVQPPQPVQPTAPVQTLEPLPNPELAPPTPAGPPADGVIRTTADLAATFEVEEPQLLQSLSIVGADNQLVPLAEVIENYKQAPDAAAVAAQRATLESDFAAKRTELQQVHDATMHQTAELAAVLQAQLAADQKTPREWAEMQATDSERYANERLVAMERENALRTAVTHLRERAAARETAQKNQAEEFRTAELPKIHSIHPELANPATAGAHQAKIATLLGSAGFTQSEIDGISDSRFHAIIRKALTADELQSRGAQAIAAARDRGLPAPVPGPSARPDTPGPVELNARRITQLREHAQATGTVQDAGAAFAAMLEAEQGPRYAAYQ
jgi:hypothetical protein